METCPLGTFSVFTPYCVFSTRALARRRIVALRPRGWRLARPLSRWRASLYTYTPSGSTRTGFRGNEKRRCSELLADASFDERCARDIPLTLYLTPTSQSCRFSPPCATVRETGETLSRRSVAPRGTLTHPDRRHTTRPTSPFARTPLVLRLRGGSNSFTEWELATPYASPRRSPILHSLRRNPPTHAQRSLSERLARARAGWMRIARL